MTRLIDLRKNKPETQREVTRKSDTNKVVGRMRMSKQPEGGKKVASNIQPPLVLKKTEKKDEEVLENSKGENRDYLYWETPTSIYDKARKQVIKVILVGVFAGMILWWLQHNHVSLVVFALAITVAILNYHKGPAKIQVTVSDAGVTIGGRTYYFNDLASFWVEYNPGGLRELSFENKKWYMPYLKVPIQDQDPLEVRARLIKFLPEKEHNVSIIDIFMNK
jgi:hypothetical protein